jgi:hypothetical protein
MISEIGNGNGNGREGRKNITRVLKAMGQS